FLTLLAQATASGNVTDIRAPEFAPVREMLGQISVSRAVQSFTPSETATFVFSLKQPLFARLRREHKDAAALADELWAATALLDKLGLYTTEVFQQNREDVIRRQQEEMLELSTPVVTLWDGILALPMIGTLDSARTQVVMESLLQRIVETGSEIAIIDIRPQIAQTMVHLAIDLSSVTTKSTLADAFVVALDRIGASTNNAPSAANGTARAAVTANGNGAAARRP